MRFEHWIYTVPLRLRSLFRRGQVEQELDEEVRYHVEQKTQEYISAGLSPEEARYAALRAMGGIEQRKEECRDTRRVGFIDDFIRDLRYGIRMLRRAPGFAAAAIISLALGIGANTAVFSLIDALFLRALPVTNPQELVSVKGQRSGGFGLISFPMYRDLRDRQEVFTDILATAGESPVRMTIPESSGGSAELDNMRVSYVSGNYFEVLGVAPAIGRLLNPEDDRGQDTSETLGSVIVLSDSFWERQFGRDVGVLGRTILIGRSPCKVIGVAPRGFFGEAVGNSPAAWAPLVPFSSADNLESRMGTFTVYMARLKPGVTRAQAQSAMTMLFQQLLTAEGRVREGIEDNVIALDAGNTGIDYFLRRTFARPLRIIMAIVALVLLIACANVANLLLARAASRSTEIGIRLATGCSRSRLIRQLLTESTLLSLAGAVAGIGLAYVGSHTLLRLMGSGPVPIRVDLSPDFTVMSFLVAAGLVTGIGFGLVPALQASRVDVATAIKGSLHGQVARPSRQRTRRLLVTCQVALSMVLLIGSGLLIRSFQKLHEMDWGFRKEEVVIFDLAHNPQHAEPAALADVAWRVQQRVRQVPGVESASISGVLLFSPSDIGAPLRIRDYTPAPGERVAPRYNAVSAGYLETLGMTLVDGRSIEERDGQNAPAVAVINEAMARRYFGGGPAVGRLMELDLRQGNPPRTVAARVPSAPIEIVGVVRDAKYNNLREDAKPMFYVPMAQMPRSLRSLEVQTSRPLAEISGPVRNALADVTKEVMIRRVVTLSDQVEQSLTAELLVMRLSTFFGALAVLLACVGLYGVLAYSVAGRTGEIGIRMALGAGRRAVLWLVLRETLQVLIAGILIGIPLGLVSVRLVASLLYGLTPGDPATLIAATMLLVLAAGLASLIPARRAAMVDPMEALRYE